MKKNIIIGIIMIVLITMSIVIFIGYWLLNQVFDFQDNKDKVALVEKSFTLLQEKEVVYYHFQSKCKTLIYKRGAYTWNPENNSNCLYQLPRNIPNQETVEFSYREHDEESLEDFSKIQDYMDKARVGSAYIGYQNKNILYGDFWINTFNSTSYFVYSSSSYSLKNYIGDSDVIDIEPVSNKWVKIVRDWN